LTFCLVDQVKIARAPNSSNVLRAKYVDEAAIGKACAPGATPPDEVAEDTVGALACWAFSGGAGADASALVLYRSLRFAK
jgi:hypothetical protein